MAKTSKRPEIADIPTEDDIKRGDEILKRMLQSKPKPHKDIVGKGKKGGEDDGGKPTKSTPRRR